MKHHEGDVKRQELVGKRSINACSFSGIDLGREKRTSQELYRN